MTEIEILKRKLDLAMKYLTAIEYSASIDGYTTNSREHSMRQIERQAQIAKQQIERVGTKEAKATK